MAAKRPRASPAAADAGPALASRAQTGPAARGGPAVPSVGGTVPAAQPAVPAVPAAMSSGSSAQAAPMMPALPALGSVSVAHKRHSNVQERLLSNLVDSQAQRFANRTTCEPVFLAQEL